MFVVWVGGFDVWVGCCHAGGCSVVVVCVAAMCGWLWCGCQLLPCGCDVFDCSVCVEVVCGVVMCGGGVCVWRWCVGL